MPPYKLLLAQADAPLRRTLRRFLEGRGYAVLEAASGAEALALAEGQHPDLILLDLELRDPDGLEVAQELRRRPRTARSRLVLLTAQPFFGPRGHVVAALCEGTIPKPVTPEGLERDLRLLLVLQRRGGIRRFPRYPVEVPVWCWMRTWSGPPETSYAAGVARTLSQGGVMVELPTLVPPPSLLDLLLRTPAGEVTAAGRVVWSRGRADAEAEAGVSQHGVQFLDMEPDKFAALHGMIHAEATALR